MRTSTLSALALASLLTAGSALAQTNLTLPPGGANQRSVVTQYMGMVSVTIDYNSPDVHAPNGDDRRGQIWGQLVPYGFTNLGFGNGNPGPWRVGANENTTFTVSHDVEVEGQPLAAGTYGLHMAAGEDEWIVIFSKNSTSWGSFFYDEADDALRVTVKPQAAPYREWLNFDFIDRQLGSTTVAMQWEELQVPFTVSVPDITSLYVEKLRNDLKSSAGFSWLGWNTAANYCLNNDVNLEEALTWAETAISSPFFGLESFATLSTKAQILAKLNRGEEAQAVMQTAHRASLHYGVSDPRLRTPAPHPRHERTRHGGLSVQRRAFPRHVAHQRRVGSGLLRSGAVRQGAAPRRDRPRQGAGRPQPQRFGGRYRKAEEGRRHELTSC